LWQIHIFGEGNTRTTAVFLIKYLRKLGFNDVNNDLFAQHSWYFRNALVRANYKNLKNGVYATNKYLIQFLENLLLNENNILKNKELHIHFAAHENVSVKEENVSAGVSVKEKIVDLIAQKPTITVKEMAKILSVTERTIYRQIDMLKTENRIARVGSDKTGNWTIVKTESSNG
jgi:predicted HTH transcriptional regulator